MVIAQLQLDWQEGKDKQENEIVAVPKLLDMLNIKGAVVTADAISTQTAIAEKIVDKGADYVLSVKDNQPTLRSDIERYFDRHPDLPCKEKTDFGHGRVETRRCTLSADLSYLADPGRWKGLAAIAKIHSERLNKRTGETNQEDRYFITTLTDTERVMNAVRSHWGVESMHWSLDVTFGEDSDTKREGNSAENFNIIRKMALNVLKNDGVDYGKKRVSLKRRMLKAANDDQYLKQLIGLI